MLASTSLDGDGFDNRAYHFRAAAPTSAALLNALAGNDRLWRDGKAFSLPGETDTTVARAEAGGAFWVWQHLGDNETKTLLNASHFDGIMPLSFGSGAGGGLIGAKHRVVYLELWYAARTTLTYITTYLPGFYTTSSTGADDDSDDWKVFAGAAPTFVHGTIPFSMGFYSGAGSSDGSGNHRLLMTVDGDHTFTVWADNENGDLKVRYEYGGISPDQYISMVCKIHISPMLC